MNKALRIFLTIICLLMIASIGPAFSRETYNFELMWGSQGTGDGQFWEKMTELPRTNQWKV